MEKRKYKKPEIICSEPIDGIAGFCGYPTGKTSVPSCSGGPINS